MQQQSFHKQQTVSRQQPVPRQQPTSQQQALKDWLVDGKNKSVRHSSGLVIRLSGGHSSHKPAALDILSIEKLAGTPWATRSNALIEAGISLLTRL
jgi:hypothetical protein